ncbi:hypothetical protein BY458DRAFT_459629 [Sporodiniella umbellata]|nr:hypothetical protein BY458DRAFT_459629 [Sporodiniella umbellata]
MNVSSLLNPVTTTPSSVTGRSFRTRSKSTPLLQRCCSQSEEHNMGKSRSRFSEYEDNVIRDGVAQGLTWGQISELLPHRKRATCFNRYRTLKGVRKSRKSSTDTSASIPQHQDIMIYQTKLSFSALPVSEVSSEASSSDDDNDETSYSPPLSVTKLHRMHRSLPSDNSVPLYRRYSAFHHL